MRIAIVGDLTNLFYSHLEFLERELGAEVELFVRSTIQPPSHPSWAERGPAEKLHYFTPTAAGRVKLLHKLARFDIVHFNEGFSYAWACPRPYVAFVLGIDVPRRTIKQKLVGAANKLTFQRAKAVLVGNPSQVHSFREQVPCAIFVPNFGFPPSRRPKAKPNPREPIIYHAGSADFKTKGTDRFLEAARLYYQRNPASRARIVMTDWGVDREPAHRLARELELEKRIEWIPLQRPTQFWERLAAASVVVDQFVVGSFGIVGLQAMLAQRPLIGYLDNHAYSSLYSERVPALNARTPEQITKALEIAEDSREQKRVGGACYKWVRKHHDPKRVIAALGRLYREAREGRSVGTADFQPLW